MWISRGKYDDLRMALGGLSQRGDFYKAMYEREVKKRKELQRQLAKALKGSKTSAATGTVPTGSFYGVNF